ncbi:MAG: hypothetical protein F6J89_33900 [Symploca sp. SIO1C4]|uniref:Uncharacterized protein n=1 Tax=Symploca sp. SIO1C4 TaxID=2607765 RepID=A0A6B3NQN3_9CYAN|nr:hypothetical protein [Symploca sp. SIO1C4]
MSPSPHLPLSPSPPLKTSQSQTCPAELETLTSVLLKDLPGYANRVIQRARRLERTVDNFSYVVVAGKPEFEPLPLGPTQPHSSASQTQEEEPQQVFFTTLERSYRRGKVLESQNFHRLFLIQTADGWRLVTMFSQIGSSQQGRSPTPPRESSNSVIGQAVNIWLRDCRAGTIKDQVKAINQLP